jgi:hypothetical protein
MGPVESRRGLSGLSALSSSELLESLERALTLLARQADQLLTAFQGQTDHFFESVQLHVHAARVARDPANTRWVAEVREEIAKGIEEGQLVGREELLARKQDLLRSS